MGAPKMSSSSGIKIRDRKARNIGLLVGVSGEVYFTSISRVSDVYIECIRGSWISWRGRYYIGDNKPSGIKIISKGTFDHVLVRTEKYLAYVGEK